MTREIISRSFWSFIVLADIFAAIGLYELSAPKDRTIAYIWDVSYNWKAALLGMVCVSVAVAIITLAWPAVHDKRIGSSAAQ